MRGTRNSTRAARADQVLGDPQAGEGLAGAAGHHQLAAVASREPGADVLQRLLLVRAQLLAAVGTTISGVVQENCDQSMRASSR